MPEGDDAFHAAYAKLALVRVRVLGGRFVAMGPRGGAVPAACGGAGSSGERSRTHSGLNTPLSKFRSDMPASSDCGCQLAARTAANCARAACGITASVAFAALTRTCMLGWS